MTDILTRAEIEKRPTQGLGTIEEEDALTTALDALTRLEAAGRFAEEMRDILEEYRERERHGETALEAAEAEDKRLREALENKLVLMDLAAQATTTGNVAHNIRSIRGYIVQIREVLAALSTDTKGEK